MTTPTARGFSVVMPRYRLDIEYDGSAYAGWQRQAGQHSVQAAIEQAIAGFCGEDVTIRGAGRTDAGVHATGQVAHVDLAREWPADTVRDAVNAHLQMAGETVSVLAASIAAGDFDARFSAVGRHYLYRIVNRRAPLALEAKKAWWVAKAARCRGDACGRASAGRQARFHHLPLRAVPGEEPGQDARPARRGQRTARRSRSAPRRAPSCTIRSARWSAR